MQSKANPLKEIHMFRFANLALAAALTLSGASAFAGPQPAGRIDPPVAPAGAFPTCSAFCAVINSDGSIARAHIYTTASHLGTGNYQVLFYTSVSAQKNVSKCAYNVTPGTTTNSGVQGATFATVAGRAGTTNGVFISTYDQTGAVVDAPFHLVVSC